MKGFVVCLVRGCSELFVLVCDAARRRQGCMTVDVGVHASTSPLARTMFHAMTPSDGRAAHGQVAATRFSTGDDNPGSESWPSSSSTDVVDHFGRPVARPLRTQPWVCSDNERQELTPERAQDVIGRVGCGAPRRRRVSGKRPPDSSPEAATSVHESADAGRAAGDPVIHLPVASPSMEDLELQFATFTRQVHKKAWDAMRALWQAELLRDKPVLACDKANPQAWTDRQTEARQSFQQLNEESKSALARRAAEQLQQKGGDVEVVRCLQQKSISMEQRIFILDRQTVLLTYVGNWPEVANIPVPEGLGSCAEAVDAVAAWLRTHRGVAGLWDNFFFQCR